MSFTRGNGCHAKSGLIRKEIARETESTLLQTSSRKSHCAPNLAIATGINDELGVQEVACTQLRGAYADNMSSSSCTRHPTDLDNVDGARMIRTYMTRNWAAM